jgi:hypothetical protein
MADSTSAPGIDVSTFAEQLANATNIFEMFRLTALAQTAVAQRTSDLAKGIQDLQCAVEKLPETAFTLKPLCLDPATIDAICKTCDHRFAELHTHLSETDERVGELDRGFAAASRNVADLAANQKGSDEALAVFRDNIHSRLQLLEEEIRQIRGVTYAALGESATAGEALQETQERQAIVEAEVAELAADLEEARPAAKPRSTGRSRPKGAEVGHGSAPARRR